MQLVLKPSPMLSPSWPSSLLPSPAPVCPTAPTSAWYGPSLGNSPSRGARVGRSAFTCLHRQHPPELDPLPRAIRALTGRTSVAFGLNTGEMMGMKGRCPAQRGSGCCAWV